MAIGLPDTIDFRGVVKRNADGTFDSAYPAGDKPTDPPSAITDLAVDSIGSTSAALSWTLPANTDNVRVYKRDVTASGSFNLIETLGAVETYNAPGLDPETEYEWYVVASNEEGDSGDSNVVSGTTAADIGDNYQLQAGEYPPERFPFQWVNPNGDETDRSAYKWMHSQFDYERVVTVTGGSPPYYFYLTNPVSGVSIERKAPLWNPFLYCWAELVIDHTVVNSGSVSFEINAIDQNGTLLTLPMTVTVDDSKFVGMDNVNGSPTAAGTINDPYDGLESIYTNDANDATHAGKIIVARGGGVDYLIDNFDSSLDSLRMDDKKPVGWIPYPGESISFDVETSIFPGSLSGHMADYYYGPATYNGSDGSTANSRVFNLLSTQERVAFDKPRFMDPVVGTSGTDNTSCVYTSGTNYNGNPWGHRSISIVDPYWENLPSASNGMSAFDFFAAEQLVVAGGSVRNSSFNYGFWFKRDVNHAMIIGADAYDTEGQTGVNIFKMKNNTADVYTPPGIIQAVGCKGFYPLEDGDNQFQDRVIEYGDTNSNWGSVYCDRMTVVGVTGPEGSANDMVGTAYMEDSLVFSNVSEPIHSGFVATNNVSGSRSEASSYIDSQGDVIESYQNHGLQGANFAAPEVQ